MKRALVAAGLGILLLAAMILPASGQWYGYTSYYPTTYTYSSSYSWYDSSNWNYNYNWNSNSSSNYNYNRNRNVNFNTNSGGGTVCTMDYRYGLTIYLQDENGQPLTNAVLTATNGAGQATNDFQSLQNGQYSGLGEGQGYYTFTIQRTGYATHRETIKLEKDSCHVIPQVRTITLFQ